MRRASPPRRQVVAIVSLAFGIAALAWCVGMVVFTTASTADTRPRSEPVFAVFFGWLFLVPALVLSLPAIVLGIVALVRGLVNPGERGGKGAAIAGLACAGLSWLTYPLLPVAVGGAGSASHRLEQARERREETQTREGACEGLMKVLADSQANAEEARRGMERWGGDVPPPACLSHAVEKNAPAVVQWMIDHGADVNTRSPGSGYTPVGAAVNAENVEMLRRLLAAGADPNEGGIDGPPLHVATARKNLPLLRLLLNGGAQVDIRSRASSDQQATALHKAMDPPRAPHEGDEVVVRRVAIVRELLGHGANLTIQDAAGLTPLHRAAYASFPEGAELLLRRCAEVRCQPAPLEVRDRQGLTPLDVARRMRAEQGDAFLTARRDRMIATLQPSSERRGRHSGS